MNTKKIVFVVLASISVCFLPLFQSGLVHASQEENMRIIIKYKDSSKPSFANTEGKLEVRNINKKDFGKIKKELERKREVEFVEEDGLFEFSHANDPYFPYQQNSFQIVDVQGAWADYQPDYQPIVAVIDSGIDHQHPDLKETIVNPFNVLSPSSMPVDEIGHGTHVAGIIGAKTNNNIGIASIAKNVKLMPIKVGDRQGAFVSDIAEGIRYAVDHGADIINISIAGPQHSITLREAVVYALEHDVLVVAAAGNNGTDAAEYPAGYPGVLGVGASSKSGDLSAFSNFGEAVSVVAPGEDIFSTLPGSFSNTIKGYGTMEGTSMSAPTVASQASLLKSTDKELSANQLKHIIEMSSIEAAILPVQYGLINLADSLRYYHTKGRIFGANSLETSMQIAKEGWSTVNESSLSNGSLQLKGKFSVLASNQSFADSLSVVPLAFKLDSPIFLSEKNYLPQASIASMKELGVDHVIVIGGKNAISESVELKLQENGLKTTRIYGKTRYETAVEIGKFVAEENGEVMVVNGKSFPDALSASVEAATKSMPIIFVEQNALPNATKDFLSSYHFSQTYIIGGKQPISENIEKSLNATRISGSNRYETNIAVASYFNSDYRKLFFATGANFKDALTGGLLAAKRNSGLLLVSPKGMDGTTRNFLQINRDKDFNVIGGKKAIPSNVIWDIDRLLSGNQSF